MSLYSDLNDVLTPYAQRIKGLTKENTELKADLGDKIGVIGSVKGYYINLTTDPVDISNPSASSTGLAYSIVDCSEGDKFVINAVGAASGRAWGFLDSSNHVLSMADANATVENLVLVAPTNAVKLIINDKGGGISYKADNNLVSRVSALETAEPEFSTDVKTALMALVSHIGVWTDGNGQSYIDALEDALYEAGTIKVFIGKGTSGPQIIDNPKRALTEPIPFRNEIPITVARSISGEDDGYRYAVKWCVDESTIWVPPSDYPVSTFETAELNGWLYSNEVKTWCKDENNSTQAPHVWIPDTFRADGNDTFRIMFANVNSIDDPLPALPPKGYIIVNGKKYRLEVGDNEDFV